MADRIIKWLRDQACEWLHGGGKIKRDAVGQINWQCCCGRWALPVPAADEAAVVDAAISAGAAREPKA